MMQDKKILTFHLLRFHLLPLSSEHSQLNLFPEKTLSKSELIAQKNNFFREVLNEVGSSVSDKFPIALHVKEDGYYVFKIANKKSTELYEDFKAVKYPTSPFSYVVINTDEDVQKIAISDNVSAFSSPSVVKNLIKKIFQKMLKKYYLNIEIKEMFEVTSFWDVLSSHEKELTLLDFTFIKPNLARIHNTLKDSVKDFTNKVNSHETHLTIKAPENGVLENIDKSNDTIKGLAEYSSQGGGNIKIKVKGIRKKFNTLENPVVEYIDEVYIEGSSGDVIKAYKSIVE